MDIEDYLVNIINKYSISSDIIRLLNITDTQAKISKIIKDWAGVQLNEVKLSGSVAKGTAISSSADLDLFVSLKSDTAGTWQEIYDSLVSHLKSTGYQTRVQNVSIRINHQNLNIDLTIGKRFSSSAGLIGGLLGFHDHTIRTRKNNSWTKTNIEAQIKTVKDSGRINEIKLVKIWRDLNGLDFPSIYLELSVINALKTQRFLPVAGSHLLSQRFMKVLNYLANDFENAIIDDPGNSSNRISEDLSPEEKKLISNKAKNVIGKLWTQTLW